MLNDICFDSKILYNCLDCIILNNICFDCIMPNNTCFGCIMLSNINFDNT